MRVAVPAVRRRAPFLAALLVALAPAPLRAAPLTLRWTQPAESPAPSEFRVYKGASAADGERVWTGLPEADADGVYAADVALPELDEGLPVYVWVTAANAAGESLPSEVRSFNAVCNPEADANCDGVPDAEAGVLSVENVMTIEGGDAVFAVRLTGGSGGAVSVDYATEDGSARAGDDYEVRSGSLSLGSASPEQQIHVPTVQDGSVEDAETFELVLGGASGASLGVARATATILDDDEASPPATSGPPELQEIASGSSLDSFTVSTAAPLAAAGGALYLAAVSAKSDEAVTAVTGLGLDWTPVRAQCGGRAQTGVALYQAYGSPSAGGVVTASFAEGPSAAVIVVARYAGVRSDGALGSVASANSLGPSGGCIDGVDATQYAFDVPVGEDGALVFAAVALRSRAHTPGAGSDELTETRTGTGGSDAGIALVQRPVAVAGTTSVNGTFSGLLDWAGVAVEIRGGSVAPLPLVGLGVSTTGNGRVELDPPGGLYPSGTTVTLTALPDPGFRFSSWSGSLTGRTSPASLTLDGDAGVLARFVAEWPVTVSTTGGGSVLLDPPGGVYTAGRIVSLTAVPVPGSEFLGWSGDLSGTDNPALLLVSGPRTVGAAFTPSTAPTIVVSTFTASADAMVKSTSATNNYGSDAALRVRAASPQWNSFVRFDLAGLSGSVTRATLRLWVTDGSSAVGSVFAVPSTWTEGGLTWQNAPALGGTPLTRANGFPVEGWVELDVTPAVAGNGPVAFGLLSSSTSSTYFSSREGAHPPELVVTTNAP